MIDIQNIPIVLVHGYQGDPGIWSYANYFFITKGYSSNIYAFDYRGTTEQSITSNANRMWQFLKEKNLTNGPIILIGHSMGGLVSRKVALDHPELNVIKLVTLATPNYGASDANWCVIPNPWCPDAVLDMKPKSDFIRALNKNTVFQYTPGRVLTYSIKGDELVSDKSAIIDTAKNLTFTPYANNKGGAENAEIHISITEKEEVLNNVLDFIKEEYTTINGGPHIYGGKCKGVPDNNATICWSVPKGSPYTLEMQIITLKDLNSKHVKITVPANDTIKKHLPNGYVFLRFYDPSANIVTGWSSVHFDGKLFSCKATLYNHINIITNWNDRF